MAAVGRPEPAGQYVCTSYKPGGSIDVGKYAVSPPTFSEEMSVPLNAAAFVLGDQPALATMSAPSIMYCVPTTHENGAAVVT